MAGQWPFSFHSFIFGAILFTSMNPRSGNEGERGISMMSIVGGGGGHYE